jgi:hypothetical protein
MQHAAKLAAGDDSLQLLHCGPEAPVVADGEAHASVPAGRGHGARVCGLERERLFAKDVLSRLGRGDDLLAVQRMRRCEHHGLDRRICERVRELGAARDVDLAHETDAAALLDRFLQRAPPAAKAHDGGVDHSGWMPACRMSRDHFTISLLM